MRGQPEVQAVPQRADSGALLEAARVAVGSPGVLSLLVPAWVPFGAFPAGGAEEAKEEEEKGEEPPLALRALPEEPAEPRRSTRKRKGPDHGPFLG